MAEKVYNWTDDPMISGVADCNTDVVNDCLMHLKYENTTDAIQNMYETGQVETQTRGFEQLKQMRRSTFDLSKFTVVGSPTITDDGVASGFSSRNYLTSLLSITPSTYIKIKADIIYSTVGNTSNYPQAKPFWMLGFNDWRLLTNYGTGINFNSSDVGNIHLNVANFKDGDLIKTETIITNTEITIKVNYKDKEYTTSKLYDFSFGDITSIKVGSMGSPYYFTGSINLPHFSITVDGKEVFNGNKTGLDVIKPDNYTVVGSPVISADGVASGFNGSNYLKINNANFSSNNYEISIPFNTSSTSVQNTFIATSRWASTTNNFAILISHDGQGLKLLTFLGTGSSWDIANGAKSVHYINANTNYLIRFIRNNGKYIIRLLNKDTGVETEEISITSSSNIGNISNLLIGTGAGWFDNATTSSIDLNAFKIYVDGNLVYQPCLKIPYTESKTGSKIVDVAYRDRVIDLYEQEGQAGYYTIDEPNKNFTLPIGEIYGMIEQKGTYQPPLLSTMWSDHLLNDMSWLRADTFSWQDGTTYSQAYNELLTEYNDSSSVEETEGEITFKRTPKGYKIALATQETAIDTKYATNGIAWYYILDTANKKFKLPRAKHPSLVTLTNSVPVYGNGMTLGITNGTTNYGLAPSSNTENNWAYRDNAYGTTLPRNHGRSGNTPGDGQALGITTDTTKSGIVADLSNNVKDYNMYLYFYVGAFTKSAEAQTAGLKAELLNSKVDILQASGAGMPSSRYINLTLGTSGSTYTAPANGWFMFRRDTTSGFVGMEIVGKISNITQNNTGSAAAASIFCPAQKGDTCKIIYSGSASGTPTLKFIYAEGAKND